MKRKKSTTWLVLAFVASVASVLQAVGLARYAGRLPDDWVGIGLYAATLFFFAVAAFGFSVNWAKERRRERE